jgi:serine phosphatase RsbU (regulator of sigma subunit)
VGLLQEAEYEEGQTVIRPGDIVALYSDGVTEATNQSGDEFGVGRLSAVITAQSGDFKRACERVLEAVGAFTGRIGPEDDQTVMMVRFASAGFPTQGSQPSDVASHLPRGEAAVVTRGAVEPSRS